LKRREVSPPPVPPLYFENIFLSVDAAAELNLNQPVTEIFGVLSLKAVSIAFDLLFIKSCSMFAAVVVQTNCIEK
jgi:hypothetical protein